MEIRVLQYFLAIAREESILGAAEFLHISQPTLSRKIRHMEEELGKQLFIRGNRKIELTDEGLLLRRRAKEIMNSAKKTENEIMNNNDIISGDVYIGAGETAAISFIANTASNIKKRCPSIHYHISSDDARDIQEQLDKGLIDIGVIIGEIDKTKYDFYQLPVKDTWGLLMRSDSPLAEKEHIKVSDIRHEPLIISRQLSENHDISNWFPEGISQTNVTATYNLVYNATYLVNERIGYALTLDGLINTSGDCDLCMKPLFPKVETNIYIIWKKYQMFSKATAEFLRILKLTIDEYKNT